MCIRRLAPLPLLLALAFGRAPAHAQAPPIGINLGGNVPYDTGKAWVNMFRYFREWKPQKGTAAVPLTDSGYPTVDAQSGTVADYPPGTYRLRFRGTATVAFDGRGAQLGPVTRGDDGTARADLTLDKGGTGLLSVSVSGLDGKDPLRDMQLIRPGYDPEDPPTFSEDFLRRLRPFAVVREMCWSGVNTSNQVAWADRRRPEDWLQTGGKGVAYELQIELANVLKKPIWICVPDGADDDYVAKLADLVRDMLDPELPFYLEYSNELWNSGFDQTARNVKLALADPVYTGASATGKAAARAAWRTHQVVGIFRHELGPGSAGRIRAVIGAQCTVPSWANAGLKYLKGRGVDPGAEMYGVAIAPYMLLAQDKDVAGLTLDQLFAGMAGYLVGKLAPSIAAHIDLARPYGLKVVAYEGGQSLVDFNRAARSDLNHDVKSAAQADVRMGGLHRQLLATWQQAGGDLFSVFGPPSNLWDGHNGYWGLLPDQDEPGGAKWDAILGMILPPGDVTLDGKADWADYLTMARSLGKPGPLWREQGDLTGDGKVDAQDVAAWQAVAPALTDPQQAEVQAASR